MRVSLDVFEVCNCDTSIVLPSTSPYIDASPLTLDDSDLNSTIPLHRLCIVKYAAVIRMRLKFPCGRFARLAVINSARDIHPALCFRLNPPLQTYRMLKHGTPRIIPHSWDRRQLTSCRVYIRNYILHVYSWFIITIVIIKVMHSKNSAVSVMGLKARLT